MNKQADGKYQTEKYCYTCGQPRDYKGRCIPYKEGNCNRYSEWMPKQADGETVYKIDTPKGKGHFVEAQADGEYISRQKVLDFLERNHKTLFYTDAGYGYVVRSINELPSVAIPTEHDGCVDCKHENKSASEYPCSYCKQNYKDMWEKKTHWNHGVCDNCGYDWGKDAPIASVPNFCPNCGSPMKIER